MSKTDLVKVEYDEQNFIVQQNTESTMRWVAAVKAIRDKRLYLVQYKTFDEYIQNELPVGKSQTYALLGPAPRTQKQRKSPVDRTNLPQLNTDEHYDDVLVVFDQEGRQVPAELAELFDQANRQADALRNAVIAMNACMIAQIPEPKFKKDPWSEFNRSDFNKHKQNILDLIKFTRPWAWCPTCGGDGQFGACEPCGGRGWLTYMQWSVVPEDMRK
jgi:hypothetical protein